MRAAVLALCALFTVEAAAQAYPAKPIRVIVPVAAGGNQEITIRAVAEEMAKRLGQPLVVEARPSSSALLGTQFVARSAPDGYTLLSVSTTFARAATLVAAAGYDPVRDFVAVSLVSRIPPMLPELPTIEEQGLAGFEDVTWNALMAPAGTPRDIVERLRAETAAAVAVPELRKRFLERAIELQASSSIDEAAAFVKREVESFARLAREAN